MTINLKQSFSVKAPVDTVWRFLRDPHKVAPCMPGAELVEIVAEDTFLGNMKVKVGPITATYKGRVKFTRVDEANHVIEMTGEGTETGGGSARGTMRSRLEAGVEGGTQVLAEANAEVTGRVAQFGRGMIQGVSQQLFQQFAAAVTERLEAEPGAEPAEPKAAEPVRVLPLVFGQIWAAIVGFFRRLFGRGRADNDVR